MRPLNYQINFEPNFKTFKFRGKEKIQLNIVKPSDRIILNAAEIKIFDCYLICRKEILKPSINLDQEREELTLKFSKKVKGNVELCVDFVGTLNDKLAGFYRSYYRDPAGRKRYLATTQFEAADARRAFPCWDGPEYKATFDISVTLDKELTAISNMPETEVKNIGKNKKIVKFSRTPLMSTYIVYVGVGEFEFLKDEFKDISIRIVTTAGKKNQGKLALEYVKKFLKFYEDYFRVRYPLPKLDLIALPDFAAGAMENWGAITFREAALLYDPKTSSITTKQRIAEIISHELAHQWFGNLVTMRWWNDLWLNESFATFIGDKTVSYFYPEWDMWSQFLNSTTLPALELDALESSHPIEVDVWTPSQIREIFDEISYSKGGSILKMLEAYLGENFFRRGLKNYLLTHKYGNATTEDLWSALGKVSRKPVKGMMNTWIRQTGYPVVEADLKDSKLLLKQKRFLLKGKIKKDRSKWLIPLSIKLRSRNISKLLTKEVDQKAISRNDKWVIINYGQNGFYRVKYARKILDELKRLVEEKKLGNLDRWGLQNDLFSFCMAGVITLGQYLNFIKLYSNEDDYLVIKDIQDNLYYLYLISSHEKFWHKIKEYKQFFARTFERLSWKPRRIEKHTDSLLRINTILYLGRFDERRILHESREKFQQFLIKPSSLHPDLQGVVCSLAAWQGDDETHEIITSLYRAAQSQEEKTRYLRALSGFQDVNLLNKTLDFSLSSEVRPQDTFLPFVVASNNPYGRDIIWSWIQKNWEEIKVKYDAGGRLLLNRMIKSVSVVADRGKEEQIKNFFEKKQIPGTERTLTQTIEKLRINADFLERTRRSALSV